MLRIPHARVYTGTAGTEISGRTLIAQIDRLPSELIKVLIMDAGNKGFLVRQADKKLFRKNEVELIFEFLGHPYK